MHSPFQRLLRPRRHLLEAGIYQKTPSQTNQKDSLAIHPKRTLIGWIWTGFEATVNGDSWDKYILEAHKSHKVTPIGEYE